ncbi:MAG: aspartate/glutamate racemase family protein [Spirochaetota bacterium]
MKTIGLIGGMSWESSAVYYSLINQEIRRRLGKSHSASCVLWSFDFQEIEELQYAGQWDILRDRMYEAGRGLKAAGAEFAVLCTNTMHKVMDNFEADVGIPLLHIVDAAGEAVRADGKSRIGLLGTKFTMEGGFYADRLRERFGLDVITPGLDERDTVNDIIYQELVRGVVDDGSRRKYQAIIDGLVAQGAQGVILGCTEIGLLVKEHSCTLYDTTLLHARQAVSYALA